MADFVVRLCSPDKLIFAFSLEMQQEFFGSQLTVKDDKVGQFLKKKNKGGIFEAPAGWV